MLARTFGRTLMQVSKYWCSLQLPLFVTTCQFLHKQNRRSANLVRILRLQALISTSFYYIDRFMVIEYNIFLGNGSPLHSYNISS